MPTVIDSLIIELNLDPKKFLGGQKQIQQAFKQMLEDARRGGNETEKRGRELGDNIANLKRQALGLLTLFMGGKGIKEFFGYITSTDAATGRLAKTMDISAQELSAWQAVIKSVGGSAESAGAALGGLSTDVQRFLLGAGTGDFVRLLEALNIGLTKFDDKLGRVREKNPTELFSEIAASPRLLARTPASRSAFLGLFPGVNQDMINALLLGPDELQKRLAKGRLTAPTDAQVKQAQEQIEAQSNLTRATDRLVGAVMYLVSGPLATALNAIADFLTPRQTPITPGQVEQRKAEFRAGMWSGKLGQIGGPAPAPPPATSSAPAAGGANVSGLSMAIQRAEGFFPGSRSFANNNPGNLKYGPFAKSMGATGADDKGHAIFPNYEAGRAALEQLLKRKASGQSIDQINSWYAPGQPEWGKNVSWGLGRVGVGHIPLPGTIGAPAAAAAGSGAGSTGSTNTSTTTVTVGEVNVVTHGTDADGIARDIAPALKRQTLAAPMNHGQE